MALSPSPAERLLAGYSIVVAVVAAARYGERPWAPWVLAAHLLVLVLVALFQSPGLGRLGRGLREVVPILLLLALYGALDLLNGAGGGPSHDRTVRAWEVSLFGGEPGRDWWQRSPSHFLSWVLHAAYFSYYLIVPFPLLFFLARGDPGAARNAVSAMLATFVICYLVFLFFPVAGPYYEYPRPAAWFVDNPPARLVYGILAGGSSYGAAFPSSHVAATWVAVVATGRRAFGVAAWLALPAALLTVGVVYCQMHYAVDVVAGLAVALAVVLFTCRPAGQAR